MEERDAQDRWYDAMECEKGSTEKLREILIALNIFPLSLLKLGGVGAIYSI